MMKKKTVSSETKSAAKDPAGAEYATFLLEDAEDNRTMKSSLGLAVGLHLLLLLINFPFAASKPLAEPPPKRVFVVKSIVYQEPPPKPERQIPQRRTQKQPVPDPTPHDPEPIRVEETVVEVDLLDVDVDVFEIPDAPPEPPPVGPIHIGGDVQRPVKVHAPQPNYPEIARRTRTQGVVIVEAIIDKRGDVTNVRILKGLPMGLSEAAVKAVKAWSFKPATLNGKPVEVYYSLTINFALQ